MKECLRCNNTDLKEEYKYCPICGLKISDKKTIVLMIGGVVISKYIIESKYEEKIKNLCDNRLIGFKSRKSDTQLIVKIIETLAGEDNLSISHAQEILADIQMILPMMVTI